MTGVQTCALPISSSHALNNKNPPDQTNEEEIGSIPEKEFRVITVKMIQNLGNRMEKIQETFNKDLIEIKSKKQ